MDHQAFAQLLGNYGKFFGAIAVVVTLLYLAGQLKQNTNALRSASFRTAAREVGEERATKATNSGRVLAQQLAAQTALVRARRAPVRGLCGGTH